MARKFRSSSRKTRTWFTLAFSIPAGVNNGPLSIPDSDQEDMAMFPNFLAPGATSAETVRATRQFTIAGLHLYCNATERDPSSPFTRYGAIGLGVQGGGPDQEVASLPVLFLNELTSAWPLVVPARIAGIGYGGDPEQNVAAYDLNGSSKAMRIIKPGQTLYVSKSNGLAVATPGFIRALALL